MDWFIYDRDLRQNSVHDLFDLGILTLSWGRRLSYRTQSIDLLRKSMDWFLYDKGLRHERVNGTLPQLF